MFCASCGSTLEQDTIFCGSCGAKVEIQAKPQPMPSSRPHKTQKPSSSNSKLMPVLILVLIVGVAGAIGGIFIGQTFLGTEDSSGQRVSNEALVAPVAPVVPDAPPAVAPPAAPAVPTPAIAPGSPETPIAPLFDPAYSRMVTEEFLGLYRSIFMDYNEFLVYLFGENIWDNDDVFDILASPLTPRMMIAPYLNPYVFDGATAIIDSTIGSLMNATGFSLYDFNQDGMPEIVIYFNPMFVNGPGNPAELFVYVDGQYQLAGVLRSPRFLIDALGRLIAIETHRDWSTSASFLTINNGVMSLDFIHRWEGFDDEYIDFYNPIIPNVNSTLHRIRQLSSLENNIRDSLIQRFGAIPPVAAAPVAPAPLVMPEGFIMPFSSSRYLNENDLLGLNADELRLARNEIYARHGRRFRDEELQAHFDSMPWYIPRLPLGEEPVITDLERTNVELIQAFEGRF